MIYSWPRVIPYNKHNLSDKSSRTPTLKRKYKKAGKKAFSVKTNRIFSSPEFSARKMLRSVSGTADSHEFSFFDPEYLEVFSVGLEVGYKTDPNVIKIISDNTELCSHTHLKKFLSKRPDSRDSMADYTELFDWNIFNERNYKYIRDRKPEDKSEFSLLEKRGLPLT